MTTKKNSTIRLTAEQRNEAEHLANKINVDSRAEAFRSAVSALNDPRLEKASTDYGVETPIEALDELLSERGYSVDDGENQEEETSDLPEQTDQSNETLTIKQPSDYKELSHGHGIEINPDAERWEEILGNTSRDRLPVFEGFVNYWKINRTSPFSKAELMEALRTYFDVSKASRQNYLKKLAEKRVIYPHPSQDPNIIRRDVVQEIRREAAMRSEDVGADEPAFTSRMDKKMPNNLSQLLGDKSSAKWARRYSTWNTDEYYTSKPDYLDNVFGAFVHVVNSVIPVAKRRKSKNRGVMGSVEHAWSWYFLGVKLSSLVSSEVGQEAGRNAEQALGIAFHGVDSTEDDGVARVQQKITGLRQLFEDEIQQHSGQVKRSNLTSDAIENAGDILGVSVDAPEQEIQNAFREIVRKTHADVAENPDTQKLKEAREARDILIGS